MAYIRIKNGTTGAAPASLLAGEPAYSINDNKTYIGNGSSVVRLDAGSYTAECTTAATTPAKVATCPGIILIKGVEVTVKFTADNSVAPASLTLNINSTGAKPILYRGASLPSASVLSKNRVYKFYYNSTSWELIGDLDTDTTVGAALTTHTSNTSNPHGTTFANLAGTNPTTISGYGITDAYTETEIGHFFAGTTAISGYNKSNWDKAYGWGNHAGLYPLYSGTGATGTWEINITGNSATTSQTNFASLSVNSQAVIHSGNIGSQSVNYAESASRLRSISYSSPIDLNTYLAGGGIVYNYYSLSYWVNGPVGMSYGSVIQFDATPSSSISLQLAFDVNHNDSISTKDLWFRTRNNLGFQADWRRVFHSGNSNLTTIDWSAKNLTLAGTITGATTITASSTIQANRYIISSTGAEAHLQFIRASANYITAPASGYFVFQPEGGGITTTNSPLMIKTASVAPGSTNVTSIGLSNNRWSNVYSVLGNFSSNVTVGGTIQATTAKLTNLTDGYLPYHVSDASGLANSPIYTDGTKVGIGTTSPSVKLDVAGQGKFVSTNYPVVDIYRDTATNPGSIYCGAKLERLMTGGTATDGAGIGFYFKAPNASGASTFAGILGGALSTVTDGAEVGDIVFGASWLGADPYLNKHLIVRATGATTGNVLIPNGNVGIGYTDPGSYRLKVNGSGYFNSNLTVGGTLGVTGATTLSTATITNQLNFGSSGKWINLNGSASLYDITAFNLSIKHPTPFIDFYFGNGGTATSRIQETSSGLLAIQASIVSGSTRYWQLGDARLIYVEASGGTPGYLKLQHSDDTTAMHLVTTGGQTMYSTGVPATGGGGGATILLNGTAYGEGSTAEIYSPTRPGDPGYILKAANPSGLPVWDNITNLLPDASTAVKGVAMLAGSGSATTVAKSDHTHSGVYAVSSHTHTKANITDLGTIGTVAAISTNASTSNYLRGDGTWVTPPNTTYSVATQSANGLMSSGDKTKLDGIATGANNYSLPTASASVLGGVKIGAGISISSGVISVSTDYAATSHTHDDRYFTDTEIGNIFSGTSTIYGYNKSNWDTAHGWGNHASAGYATDSALTTHANLTTTAHGLGASAFHADNYFALSGHNHSGVYAPATHNHYSIGDDTHALLLTGTSITIHGDLTPVAGFWKSDSNGALSVDTSTYALSSHTHSYLPLSGGTVSGNLVVGHATDLNYIRLQTGIMGSDPALGALTASGVFSIVAQNTYSFGLHTWVRNTGDSYLQSGRGDANTTAYNIVLNALGGNVGIGMVPTTKLEIAGVVQSSADYFVKGTYGGFGWKSSSNTVTNYLYLDDADSYIHFNLGEGLKLNNDVVFTDGMIQGAVIGNYGVCSTAVSTGAKTVTISGFRLATGVQINVKFSNNNYAYPMTLNVSNTGAKTVKAYGDNDEQYFLEQIQAGAVVPFVYDGTYWVIPTSPSMY